MVMHPIDAYLLEGRPSKDAVIAAVLRDRTTDPRAAPFYRALELVGVRAADEALVALRLVIAGIAPEDDAVRRLRALAAVIRTAESGNRSDTLVAIAKDPGALADLRLGDDLAAFAGAARERYVEIVADPSGDSQK